MTAGRCGQQPRTLSPRRPAPRVLLALSASMAAAIMACSLVGMDRPKSSHGKVWRPRPRRKVLRALDSDLFTGIISLSQVGRRGGSVARGNGACVGQPLGERLATQEALSAG